MTYIKISRLNEVHPGAKKPDETVEFFMEDLRNRGISEDAIQKAISLYLEFLKRGKGVYPKFKRDSDVGRAIIGMEECINVLEEDGYPAEWIYRALDSRR